MAVPIWAAHLGHERTNGMNDQRQQGSQNDATVVVARDWVVRLTSGEPTAEELERFKSWLGESPLHRETFERERQFWQSLGSLEAASGPQTWGPHAAGAEGPGARPSTRPRWRAVAAAGLAAACVGLFVLSGDWLTATMLADHRTAEGELLAVDLPDGSTAHLNTDTALTVTFDDNERRIGLLRGEALFEVSADPQRPFRVEATDGVAEAVGTVFVVRHGDDTASVAVLEGQVRVTSPVEVESPSARVLVDRGERTYYAKGAPPSAVEPFDLQTAAAWREGVIVIEGLPLDQAIAELDRYRPGRIILMDAGAGYRSVSGAFDLETIDAAVAGLAATHGLSVTEVTPYLLILH